MSDLIIHCSCVILLGSAINGEMCRACSETGDDEMQYSGRKVVRSETA